MSKFKKFISILLSVTLAFGVMCTAPFAVSAAEVETSKEVGSGTQIYFDCKSAGWEGLAAAGVYCHIWRADGTGSWPGWHSKAEKCTYDASTGIATYDITTARNKGYDMNIDNTKSYCVIFTFQAGAQTYNAIMSGNCMGDTLYCKDSTPVENPVDSEKSCLFAYWKNNIDCGPQKIINSSGRIVGNALAEGTNDATILADFLISYYDDVRKMEWVQRLFDELRVGVVDVYSSVLYKEDEAVRIGDKEQYEADEEVASIRKTLEQIKDPTGINEFSLSKTEVFKAYNNGGLFVELYDMDGLLIDKTEFIADENSEYKATFNATFKYTDISKYDNYRIVNKYGAEIFLGYGEDISDLEPITENKWSKPNIADIKFTITPKTNRYSEIYFDLGESIEYLWDTAVEEAYANGGIFVRFYKDDKVIDSFSMSRSKRNADYGYSYTAKCKSGPADYDYYEIVDKDGQIITLGTYSSGGSGSSSSGRPSIISSVEPLTADIEITITPDLNYYDSIYYKTSSSEEYTEFTITGCSSNFVFYNAYTDEYLIENIDYKISKTTDSSTGETRATVTGLGMYKGTLEYYSTNTPAYQELKISVPSKFMLLGDTMQLTASSSRKITYSSSNTKVATINQDGVITAVGKGKATITVNAGGTSYGMNLTIDIYVDDEPEELLMGDVDGDGEVKIADVTYIQRALNELTAPLTDAQKQAADVNKDGKVDINDATYIQRVLAEIYPPLN